MIFANIVNNNCISFLTIVYVFLFPSIRCVAMNSVLGVKYLLFPVIK
jgi:hypothetical protein